MIKVQHNLFLWTEMWENQTKEKWQYLVRFSEAILKFGLQMRNIKLKELEGGIVSDFADRCLNVMLICSHNKPVTGAIKQASYLTFNNHNTIIP